MKSTTEKRAHRRLDIRLPLDFHPEDMSRGNVWRTVTNNVSTGGVYFETTLDDINVGDRLSLAIGVDPQDHRFPPEGKITTVGEVVRINSIEEGVLGNNAPIPRYGVGVKFKQPLKLSL